MKHEQISIDAYTQQAYYSYANYVILDRAIPRIEDGLKPVQRRILYAMSELGLSATSKPKKSARTVGDVLGKFHPHGDTACYEAMVLMAQDFSYRYPLVKGQGNWGAIDDPRSFAAMRYTESTLSTHARLLLEDLDPHTTDWGPNFDGSLKEPLVLPAKLPNILLNGCSGIAVGIATDIPPFNLREVGKACIALLENPELTYAQLGKILPGPDYPTGAEITNSPKELLDILKNGNGQIRQRAEIVKEDTNLVIKALPYQTTSSKVIQQIAALMVAKKLPQIKNIRDESDEDTPVAIVMTLRSNRVDEDDVLPLLFAETDLERNHKVNITYINSQRKPVQSGVLPLLKGWLTFREESYIKQITHQLKKHEERAHIIEGLLSIFDQLDKIIHIIRYDDDPLSSLQAEFSLSERQAQAILEIRLKQLNKIEVSALDKEHAFLAKEIKTLKTLIKNPEKRKEAMIEQLQEAIETYGDDRRTRLIERQASTRIATQQALPNDPCFIVLSQQGWVRAAKSHDVDVSQLNFKAGDSLSATSLGRLDKPTLLFDEGGVAYTLPTHELPSIRSQGEPVTKYITPSQPLTPFVLNIDGPAPILLVSTFGYGFISTAEALTSRNKSGKKVLSLGDGSIACIQEVSESVLHIALISQQGRLLIVPKEEVPLLNKGKGNKLLQLHKKDLEEKTDALSFVVPLSNETLVLSSGKRQYKLNVENQKAYLGTRGQRGLLLPRGFRRVSEAKALT